jgi:hypothetical protein
MIESFKEWQKNIGMCEKCSYEIENSSYISTVINLYRDIFFGCSQCGHKRKLVFWDWFDITLDVVVIISIIGIILKVIL